MSTAAAVSCSHALCRNNGARDIKRTLFYQDPKYVAEPAGAKHVSKKSTPFADIVSRDWGTGASHMRDTDGDKMKEVLRCLFQGQVPNTPFLFPNGGTVFSAPQVNCCLGSSTMSENAHQWFMGGWLQHRVHDDMSRLLAGEETKYTGMDRVLINEDYAPYGHPEKLPEETLAAGLTRAESSASADTVSDTSGTGQLIDVAFIT